MSIRSTRSPFRSDPALRSSEPGNPTDDTYCPSCDLLPQGEVIVIEGGEPGGESITVKCPVCGFDLCRPTKPAPQSDSEKGNS